MSDQAPAVFEYLLRGNGLGWMIELDTPGGSPVPALLDRLGQVAAEYRNRFQDNGPFTPEALTAEAERNPHKVRAFLQALRTSGSAEMLVMVWRILQGLHILQLEMTYQAVKSFRLDIVLTPQVGILAPPGKEPENLERYCSHDIFDAALVRHFAPGTVGDRPLFEGFFPVPQKKEHY